MHWAYSDNPKASLDILSYQEAYSAVYIHIFLDYQLLILNWPRALGCLIPPLLFQTFFASISFGHLWFQNTQNIIFPPQFFLLSLKKWIFKLLRLPCWWYSKLVPWEADRSWKGIGLIRSLKLKHGGEMGVMTHPKVPRYDLHVDLCLVVLHVTKLLRIITMLIGCHQRLLFLSIIKK